MASGTVTQMLGAVPPAFIFRDAPGRSPALCSQPGGDEVGEDGCWDGTDAWMGWMLGWDGCLDGTHAGMGRMLGCRRSGYGGRLVWVTSLQARGSPAQRWLCPAHLGSLRMHKPHACLRSWGLGAATPPRTPTSPLIKAANLIRAAPRCSRPVGAHQSPRGARVGGGARAAQLPKLRKHPCN